MIETSEDILPGSSAGLTRGVVLCPIICFLLLVDGLPYILKITATGRKRIGQRTEFLLVLKSYARPIRQWGGGLCPPKPTLFRHSLDLPAVPDRRHGLGEGASGTASVDFRKDHSGFERRSLVRLAGGAARSSLACNGGSPPHRPFDPPELASAEKLKSLHWCHDGGGIVPGFSSP